jgi:hypothetical protein
MGASMLAVPIIGHDVMFTLFFVYLAHFFDYTTTYMVAWQICKSNGAANLNKLEKDRCSTTLISRPMTIDSVGVSGKGNRINLRWRPI